ncbi:MAG: hypothetical protein ABW201_14375 [Candidatus Thiodiazotropha sp.]
MPYQADFTLTTATIPDMDSPIPLYSRHGTAIFFVLLVAGGIIIASMWIYAHLPINKGGKQRRVERRSGIDRRHTVMQ